MPSHLPYGTDCNCTPCGEISADSQQAGKIIEVEACCRLQPPNGFKFQFETNPVVHVCFNHSKLTCFKAPVIKQVTVCDDTSPVKCNAVAGYKVTLVGDINFAVSTPIVPDGDGRCFNRIPAQTSCTKTVPVNETLACTCDPAPCQPGSTCVKIVNFTVEPTFVNDACGEYLLVIVKVKLQYKGFC